MPYLYLVPLLTGGMAVLFLDERVGPPKLIGAALVLAGVGLARRTLVVMPATEPADSGRAKVPITPPARAGSSAAD